jgi:hypothetical protein
MSHAPGPWTINGEFDAEVSVEILDADGNVVFDLEPQSPDGWDEPSIANAKLAVAAPDLLEVAHIEHQLQMGGFTKATAKRLGPEALEAYLMGGSPGLNHWRRGKREAAIRKTEGAETSVRHKTEKSS